MTPQVIPVAADIEAFVAKLAAADRFSGVVLVSRQGQPLVRRGYGFADRSTRQRNTPDTAFMLASVGKMFTAVMVAKLVDRGQLSFETRVGAVLPDYPSAAAREQVTVRDLLTMSSGIPDLFAVPAFWSEVATARSPADLWKHFASAPLQFAPGTRWSYSNSNFLLLGQMIERITKQPFTDIVERELFRAVGLTHTRYRFHDGPKPAMGYTHVQPPGGRSAPAAMGWSPAWQEPKPQEELLTTASMGGGFSTVDDLARFLDAFASGRIVSRALAAQMMTGQIDADYGGRDGYGFETRTENGVRIVGHRGSLAGSFNEVEFYPDLGYAVAVLGNTDATGTQEIAAHVRMRLASRPHQ
jgi:CubicO group peptidase (beta-lactamase class C family)